MDHDLVLGVAHRVEHAFHQVDDVLRVRVVVDQPDEERLAEREAARLRVGHVTELVDDRLDARARLFLHQRRLVDHARNRLLRHARQPRDVVDGGVAPGLDVGAGLARQRRAAVWPRCRGSSFASVSWLGDCTEDAAVGAAGMSPAQSRCHATGVIGNRVAAQGADDRENRLGRLAGVDRMHAGDRAGGHEIAGAQRPAAPRIAAQGERQSGQRSAADRGGTAASDHCAVDACLAGAAQSRSRDCQSGTSAPSSRPALLPKSLATTAGPKSLMFCSGLLAISMPMIHGLHEAARVVRAPVETSRAAHPSASWNTNSASIAAKPCANTGTSMARGAVGALQSALEDRARPGAARRTVALSGAAIQPTFQPATASSHSAIASSWQR